MNEIDQLYAGEEEFRDTIATVDSAGKRIWIYPKKPKGWFYNARTWVSILLLALLFGIPFIKVNGEPIILFNVLEGKFIIFSVVFTPQDLHLFALAMVTFMVFIVLFTVVFGRLFCGWVCPQTIFMEMVFRKIEYWIEGDANQQIRLNKAPWTTDKWIKKVSKHTIFFAIAVVIANIFLSYIIGVDEVFKIISEPIGEHLGGFTAMIVFSGMFYGVFAFLREQVCVTICPYGRLQSVLLVPESIVVHYDFVRGEPRGKIKKTPVKKPVEDMQRQLANAAANRPSDTQVAEMGVGKELGDCIDCKLCVRVCPTGIDIRNGTQLECVNCTACMDACDEVMEKVDRPKGLIRYDSYTGIKTGNKKIFTTRVWAYTGVLVALIGLQAFLFATRTQVEALFLRAPGQLFTRVDDQYLSNIYNWEVINKTTEDIEHIEFRIKNFDNARLRMVGISDNVIAPKQGLIKGAAMIDLPEDVVKGQKTEVIIEVYSGDELIETIRTNFLGPIN